MLLKSARPGATSESSSASKSSDGGSHMMVVVRVRPENEKEVHSGYASRVVEVLSDSGLIFDPRVTDDAPQFCPGEQIREERQRAANRSRLLHFRRREKNMTFNFDRVFDDTVQNEQIYEQTTERMLDAYLTGINCSVFCYGATGAGKTFTMLGGRDQSGVIYFTMRSLYERVNNLSGAQYNVKVSYLEIYNEQVRDLLAKWTADYLDDEKFDAFLKARVSERQMEAQIGSTHSDEPNKRPRVVGKPTGPAAGNSTAQNAAGAKRSVGPARTREQGNDLLLLEDAQVGVMVQGITYHEPATAEELMRMLAYGNMQRTQHPTDANSESSRSHAVFQVYFRQKVLSTDQLSTYKAESMTYRASKFSLIDLAGSERATATSNNGMRFREGANINKSLLALGNCINSLADGKKAAHIPYRNSKLTRLLKDSLAGNCQTCMIAAVSPSAVSYEDTYNTLKYADRARAIRIDIRQNVVSATISTLDLSKMVDALRRENAQLKVQLEQFNALPVPETGPSRPANGPAKTAPKVTAPPAPPAAPAPSRVPPREAVVLDQARARLFERDLRLLRKLESWRRMKALNVDSIAEDAARERLSQFIDANYSEQTASNVLCAAAENTVGEQDSNIASLVSLAGALCAEADEDKQLIRDLLNALGRYFVLLRCERLATQANVDEMEQFKQRIVELESARSRQFRHPLTRAAQSAAAKREACGVRWAERLEVDQPRTAYFDEPETPDDDDASLSGHETSPTIIADHLSALAALPNNAQRVQGLNAQALSRLNIAQVLQSLFTVTAPEAKGAKKNTTASQPAASSRSLSFGLTRKTSNAGEPTSSNAHTEKHKKPNIVVDEVDRFKKRNLLSAAHHDDVKPEEPAVHTDSDPIGQSEMDTSSHNSSVNDDEPTVPAGQFVCRARDSIFIKRSRTGDSNFAANSTFTIDEDNAPISSDAPTQPTEPALAPASPTKDADIAPSARRARKRMNNSPPHSYPDSTADAGSCPKKLVKMDSSSNGPTNTSERTSLSSSRGVSSSNLRATMPQKEAPAKLRRFASATNCPAAMHAGSSSSPTAPATRVNRLAGGAFTFRQTYDPATGKPGAATLSSITNHSSTSGRPLLRARRASSGRNNDDDAVPVARISQNNAPATATASATLVLPLKRSSATAPTTASSAKARPVVTAARTRRTVKATDSDS